MADAISFSAVLLAGGGSTRMGRDKALLEIDGVELWRRQWALLARTGARELFLSVRPEQCWVPEGLPVVHDASPNAGPLAGIVAALDEMHGSHLLVLAVDMPRMQMDWWRRLMQRCEPGVGAAGRRAGRFEPLAAIYPGELRAQAAEALARGELSLQTLITTAGAAMVTHDITSEEAAWLANWNEPKDMA